ncbi:MAG TPA: sodium:proton antiporter, partial [Candidatus Wallbacteria bacterium]|nr:sodium:proton antiporter [Candidatus Wallbacteria bacterium]
MVKKIIPRHQAIILVVLAFVFLAVIPVFLSFPSFALATNEVIAGHPLAVSAPPHAAYTVSPLMIIPFVLLLLAIAVMPFINKHFWEHNYPYVSYALGAFVVVYYIFSL